MGDDKTHLEVAIIRENLESALRITDTWGRAVFGTMDGVKLVKFEAAIGIIPVYFYEPG